MAQWPVWPASARRDLFDLFIEGEYAVFPFRDPSFHEPSMAESRRGPSGFWATFDSYSASSIWGGSYLVSDNLTAEMPAPQT